MARIIELGSQELEKLRHLVLEKYRSDPNNPKIKINSYKPGYIPLLTDIQNSIPHCAEAAGLSRLVKLIYFTNPSLCAPSQIQSGSFGSDFIDCCYQYATNGSFNRDSFLLNNKGTKEKSIPVRKLILAILAFLIILLSGYFIIKNQQSNIIIDEEKSIAVLPFVDLSQDGDQEYLGDGIAEEVRNTLSKYENLKVIARTSSFQFRGEKVDIREVGERLGVSYVVEGSVRKFGDHIRVTAQLITASDGSHIWSNSWNRAFIDLFSVQDEIAGSISKQLQTSLGIHSFVDTRGTNNVEAYEYYLKGEQLHLNFYNRHDLEAFNESIDMFSSAIEIDTTFAFAYAGLANLYHSYNSWKRDTSYIQNVIENARTAYRLNPNSYYINTIRAYAYFLEGYPIEAHSFLVKAVQLDPVNAIYAYGSLAFFQELVGLIDEAKILYDRALSIDPLNSLLLNWRGRLNIRIGLISEGISDFKNALLVDDKHVNALTGMLMASCYREEIQLAEQYIDQLEGVLNEEELKYRKALLLAAKGEQTQALELSRYRNVYLFIGLWDEWIETIENRMEQPFCEYYTLKLIYERSENVDTNFLRVWLPLLDHAEFPALLESQKELYEANIKRFSVRGRLL